MSCPRCQGLMRVERLRRRRACLWLWACFACGERIDDVILDARRWQSAESTAARNARIWQAVRQALPLEPCALHLVSCPLSLERGAA